MPSSPIRQSDAQDAQVKFISLGQVLFTFAASNSLAHRRTASLAALSVRSHLALTHASFCALESHHALRQEPPSTATPWQASLGSPDAGHARSRAQLGLSLPSSALEQHHHGPSRVLSRCVLPSLSLGNGAVVWFDCCWDVISRNWGAGCGQAGSWIGITFDANKRLCFVKS